MDNATLEALRNLSKKLCPETAGLTQKNRECLRQFADPEKLAALLKLPKRLVQDAMRNDLGRRRDAVKAAFAVAIAIELYIPIRIKNLADLQLDKHIRRYGEKTILSIDAESTKNAQLIEAELPAEVTELLDVYTTTFRPRLVKTPSPWLFPGENGGRRPPGGFGTQIRDLIHKETGIQMTVHQFRHLAAKVYMDRHPGGLETVRRLLGHKSIATTEHFYHELDAALSSRRYAQVIAERLEETESRALKRREAA